MVYVRWMSDFHGGFLVRSIDAVVAEPIRRALASALATRRVDPETHSVAFAVRRGCPVMHVAVRGPAANGKDYAFFHRTHAALGADVARAAGVDVWVYHYENQSGTESVRAFGADGRERSNVSCSWDELDEQLDHPEDSDDDDRHERLLEAAPLGVLARELGVERGVLDYDLGYGTETVEVPLIGASCTEVVAGYLAAPQRAGAEIKPEPRGGTGLYFPSWMVDEFETHARRLDVAVGVIGWAIWEAAKPELFRTVPIVDADQPFGAVSSKPARFLTPPPSEPPSHVVVPRLVPVAAKALPEPPSAGDKVLLQLALPSRVLEELQQFAMPTDRSLSWAMQKAYLLVRGRMHAATKPDA